MIINAKDAYEAGLVNRVVPTAELLDRALITAKAVAGKSPLALRVVKRLTNSANAPTNGLRMEIASFAECFSTEDRREGMEAFLHKRRPDFKGK